MRVRGTQILLYANTTHKVMIQLLGTVGVQAIQCMTFRKYRRIQGQQVELLLSECFQDLYSNFGIKFLVEMLPKVRQKGQDIPLPQLEITVIHNDLNSFLNP